MFELPLLGIEEIVKVKSGDAARGVLEPVTVKNQGRLNSVQGFEFDEKKQKFWIDKEFEGLIFWSGFAQ